jgi:hypothetical protein
MQRQRSAQLALDLGDQHRLGQGSGAVERREPQQRQRVVGKRLPDRDRRDHAGRA